MKNPFTAIQPDNPPPHLDAQDSLAVSRERILQLILNFFSVVVILAGTAGMMSTIQAQQWTAAGGIAVCGLAIIGLTFARNLPYNSRMTAFLAVLIALGIGARQINETGFELTLLITSILAAIFLGWKGLIGSATVNVIVYLVAGTFHSAHNTSFGSLGAVFAGLLLFGLTLMAGGAAAALSRSLARQVAEQKKQSARLFAENQEVRGQSAALGVDAARTVRNLDFITRLNALINSGDETEEILAHAADLAQQLTNLRSVKIYLPNEKGTGLDLKAQSGSDFEKPMDHLSFEENDLVIDSWESAEQRILQHMQNKDENHSGEVGSRAAVPIKTGEQVFGILDLYSDRSGAFQEEQINVFASAADALAKTMENARLNKQLGAVLIETERSARAIVRQSWRSHLMDTRRKYAYRIQKTEGTPEILPEAEIEPQAARAANSGELVITRREADSETGKVSHTIALPVKVRQEVVGILTIHMAGDSVPKSAIQMLENVANRLAIALENARLLEAIQLRAEREHMVTDISARVRSSTDIDAILRTAAGELGRSLGIAEVLVQLKPETIDEKQV